MLGNTLGWYWICILWFYHFTSTYQGRNHDFHFGGGLRSHYRRRPHHGWGGGAEKFIVTRNYWGAPAPLSPPWLRHWLTLLHLNTEQFLGFLEYKNWDLLIERAKLVICWHSFMCIVWHPITSHCRNSLGWTLLTLKRISHKKEFQQIVRFLALAMVIF